MIGQRVTKPDGLRLGDGDIYALIVLTSATGVFFATYRLFLDLKLPTAFVLLAHTLVLGAVILGFNGNSYVASILTAIFPWAGYYTSIWTWPPFDAARLEGMVAGALYGTMLSLPLASLLFVAGVGLRRDGTLTDRKRSLVRGVALAILLSVAIAFALELGLLQVHGDQ